MARINPLKLKQDAAKETNAGRYEKAIELLRQIVQENPRDANTLNQIGFLYEKLNNTKAANEQYAKVADFYAKDGFYLKAIACWKKVLKNDPALFDAHLHLGDLYAKQGLTAEAKTMLGEAFDECVKRGRHKEAGEVLRRMAELDPSDMKVRIRLAELYAREGQQEKAAGEYLALADELVKKGHRQEALQLLEKGLKVGKRSPRLLTEVARVHLVQKDFATALPYLEEARKGAPDDREVALRTAETYLGVGRLDDAREALEALLARDGEDQDAKMLLGRVFLATGRPDEAYEQFLPSLERLVARREIDRAVSLLQPIAQLDPPHIPALGKLVELYRQSRNEAMVIQTYSQMVEAYLRDEEMGQAASVLELLVQLEPHNEQHRSKLDWIRKQGVEPAPLPAGVPQAPPDVTPPGGTPAAAGGPSEGTIELSGPLSPEDQEFVDEHLSEGRVFRKYGLTDKARDQFEAALNRFPDNLDARRELIDLHRERDELEKVATHLRALAQVLRLTGDEAGAAEAEASAAEAVAPEAGAPPVEAPAPEPEVSLPEAPALESEPVAEVSLDLEEGPGESPIAAAPPEPELPVEATAAPTPGTAVDEAEELDIAVDVDAPGAEVETPELELVEIPEDSPKEPAEAADEPLFGDEDLAAVSGEIEGAFIDDEPSPPVEPVPAEEDFDLGELEVPEAPSPPGADQTGGLVPQAVPAAAPVSDVPEDLQRVLSEVEQFVSLGFVEDAQEALAELGGRYTEHPAFRGKLAELGLEAPGQAGALFLESPAADYQTAPVQPVVPPTESPAPAGGTAPDEPLQLGEGFLEFTPAEPVPSGLSLDDPGPTTAPDASAGEREGGFDLASELGGLFGAQPAVAQEEAVEGTDLGDQALTDLFKEFQKGVDKQLGKEDYETRYNLGIAYKEMGLVDEAVAEFQLAAKDESRLLECASMLGICFTEKGMPKLAVKWLEKGLQAQGRTEEEYMGLRYDLGDAHEAAGETDRALEIFTELYGQDASFRDVAEKVRQLSGA
ncbi:MAG: tetratricopeptide repeat protein [Acidobacteria bacterium]|nr:tetratricopeptide repeat protein [Acidobacteriota bacterium]